MRGAALCWIALAAGGCAFDGAEGTAPIDPGSQPAPDLPKGNSRITGTISSSATLGSFGVALMPAGAALPQSNPCFPKNTPSYDTPSALDRTFVIPEVAPGAYTLVAYRVDNRVPRELERTMKAITVTGSDTDVGVLTLPDTLDPDDVDGPGDTDLVRWTAPPSLTAVAGFAFRIDGPGRSACTAGTTLNVSGTFQIPQSDDDVRVGLEWPLTGQMAIKVVEADDGRGGRGGR